MPKREKLVKFGATKRRKQELVKIITRSTSSRSAFALWSSGNSRTSSINWIPSVTFSGDTNSNTA